MRSLFKNPFTVKAIETEYDSCRFCSRLEARWAVFFNTLSIPYEYEKEGYELEGIRYLADFWLPTLDCWVEIKGQEPTEEEREKARLLALHSLKEVYTFYGNIERPNLQKLRSFVDRPAELCTYPTTAYQDGERFTELVKAPSYILALLKEVEKSRLLLYSDKDKDVVIASADNYSYAIRDLDDMLNDLQQQYQAISRLKSFLQESEQELQSVLTPKPGWDVVFLSQTPEGYEDQAYWAECNKCGAIEIAHDFINFHQCKDGTEGKLLHDTPRLIDAYKAARSARFEWWRR